MRDRTLEQHTCWRAGHDRDLKIGEKCPECGWESDNAEHRKREAKLVAKLAALRKLCAEAADKLEDCADTIEVEWSTVCTEERDLADRLRAAAKEEA